MQITSVHLCAETQTVTVRTSSSSEALAAKCLGVLSTDKAGQPTHIVLDRKLFSVEEASKINGAWFANGCYVTELSRNAA